MLEEQVCEVDGLELRYHVSGSGAPTVLVHGLAGSWRWWKPIVQPLEATLRLYLIDLPGFGSARRRAFVLAEAPAYLRALIAQIGLERPHLVGHSLGGAVCARLAALWPEAVDRLVLAAPAGLLERRQLSGYALPLAKALGPLRPALLRVVLGDALRAGPLTLYRAAAQLLADEALREELTSITAPTLLLWGEHDPLVPPRLASEYARAIPDARIALIPGAGHLAMADQPATFSQALLDFVCDDRPRQGG